jgi:hypothetical protein
MRLLNCTAASYVGVDLHARTPCESQSVYVSGAATGWADTRGVIATSRPQEKLVPTPRMPRLLIPIKLWSGRCFLLTTGTCSENTTPVSLANLT